MGPAVISLSEAVKPGDLIGLTGGTWKLADGNAKVYAELVAGEAGASGDKITAYKSALVRHADS
ncbi:MAG: hypothetical protein HY688_01115, partial [Chloroflexi bacterium]|nr:hypothetical protein [Chloroflexota bacterium]